MHNVEIFNHTAVHTHMLLLCDTKNMNRGIYCAVKLDSIAVLNKFIAEGYDMRPENKTEPAQRNIFRVIPDLTLADLVCEPKKDLPRLIPFIQAMIDAGADVDRVCRPKNKRDTIRKIINASVVLKKGLVLK